jgi:hypothetical protein
MRPAVPPFVGNRKKRALSCTNCTIEQPGKPVDLAVSEPEPFATGWVDLKKKANAFKRIYCDLEEGQLRFFPSSFPRDKDSLYANVLVKDLKLASAKFADTLDGLGRSIILEWHRDVDPPRPLCAAKGLVTLRCKNVQTAHNWAVQVQKAINSCGEPMSISKPKETRGSAAQEDVLNPQTIVALGGHRKSMVNPKKNFKATQFMSRYELALGSHGGEAGRFAASTVHRFVLVIGLMCLLFSVAGMFLPMYVLKNSQMGTSLSVSMFGGRCWSTDAGKHCHPRSWALVQDNTIDFQRDLESKAVYSSSEFCTALRVITANSTGTAHLEVVDDIQAPLCGVRPLFQQAFVGAAMALVVLLLRKMVCANRKTQDKLMLSLVSLSLAHFALVVASMGMWASTIHLMQLDYPATSAAVGTGPVVLGLALLCSIALSVFCGWQIRDALWDALVRTLCPRVAVETAAITVYGKGSGLTKEEALIRGQSMANVAGWKGGNKRDPYARKQTLDSLTTSDCTAASQRPHNENARKGKVVPVGEVPVSTPASDRYKDTKVIVPIDQVALPTMPTGSQGVTEAQREVDRRNQRKRRRKSTTW